MVPLWMYLLSPWTIFKSVAWILIAWFMTCDHVIFIRGNKMAWIPRIYSWTLKTSKGYNSLQKRLHPETICKELLLRYTSVTTALHKRYYCVTLALLLGYYSFFPACVGSVWGPLGVGLGSLEGRSGIPWGSVWVPLGTHHHTHQIWTKYFQFFSKNMTFSKTFQTFLGKKNSFSCFFSSILAHWGWIRK